MKLKYAQMYFALARDLRLRGTPRSREALETMLSLPISDLLRKRICDVLAELPKETDEQAASAN